ncbi:HEPN domain-containing protein [Moritella viscosa]|uniref:Uncharacterized protein n=1 Tax=Moritella viscosa TaxID=80854 RepID=A0A1L0B285_9GAMM|nr:HEPN domain-containing protein [Moritella viscosa]SGY95953.1 Putative uncharacterized protein [Moritella viscosa]
MNKTVLGKLFGITFSRPIELDNIVQLVEIIPELVSEKASADGNTLDEAMRSIMSDVFNFSEQLGPEESESFLGLIESEGSARISEPLDDDFEIIDPSLTKWRFYIRFKISRPLGLEQDSINFLGKYVISPAKDQSLKDGDTLILTSTDSMLYREIISESRKVEKSLILGLAEFGIGVAYPENLASEAILEKVKQKVESLFLKEHTKVYDTYYESPLFHFSDKFGVVLFQEESFPWDSNAKEENEPVEMKSFDEVFSGIYGQIKDLHIIGDKFKKIEVATSILTTSIFEDSLINKIILSMTVIEVLSDKVSRSDDELEVLDCLSNVLHEKSDVDQCTKQAIIQALNSIRVQSISKSCKILVKDLLGGKDAKLFYKLYNYRSQLVHAGVLESDRDEMLKIYGDSYDLVTRLLSAYIKRVDESD